MPPAARPSYGGHRLPRPDRKIGARPIPAGLYRHGRARKRQGGRRRAGPHAVHPIRGWRRPPLPALLGRALGQGHLHPVHHGAPGPDGRVQHAGEGGRGHGRRPPPGAFPAHAAHVQLSAVRSRGRPGARHRQGRRRGDRRGRAARIGGQGALRLGDGRRHPGPLQRLFRHALSPAQAGLHRHARCRRLRRHGELGRHHVVREGHAARPGPGHRGGPPARVPGGGARDGGPVVRRPGHHGLVGRPVAERGLRLMDGGQGHGRPAP
ncbi:hypothetical protein AZA_90384 [Nitrospirillum viridazoti Y2]|nr:hypothetical protein AZA_90384 [Nitrospirillum amazonense Y2]